MKKEDLQLQELQKITRELRAVKKELKIRNVPFWKMSLREFGIGAIKGVGFVIGTTIIAATVIYILQLFFDIVPLEGLF